MPDNVNNISYYTMKRIPAPKHASVEEIAKVVRMVNDYIQDLCLKTYGNITEKDLHRTLGNLIKSKVGNDAFETYVNQTSETIELLATKEEVYDSLDDFAADFAALAANVNGNITVWYSPTDPTGKVGGDIWFDTDAVDPAPIVQRWSGTAYTDITSTATARALIAARTAQNTADGKIRVFRQATAPTAPVMTADDVGDLWINTTTSANNEMSVWSGSAWVSARDTHLDATVNTLKTEIIQAANQIRIAAGQSTTNDIGEAIITAMSEIIVTPSRINLAVTNKAVHTLDTPPSGVDLYAGKIWSPPSLGEQLMWRGLAVSNARSYAVSNLNGASVLFNDLSDNVALFAQVKTVATQAGSGTPSPATPRAISGKASVNVRRCGKNMFNPNDVQAGTIDPSTGADIVDAGYSRISHVRVNGSTSYTISYSGAYATQTVRFYWYDANKVFISVSNAASLTGPNTFTSPANAAFMRIRVTGTFKADTQVEVGFTATAYEAYNGVDYTLTPTATLYGLTGAEDMVNTEGYTGLYTYYDVIKSTHTLVDTGMSAGVTGYFRFRVSGLPGASIPATNNIIGNIISSHFPSLSANSTYLGATGVSIDTNGWVILAVPLSVIGAVDADTSAVKLAKAKAWLDTQAVQILYQRATASVSAQMAKTAINGADGANAVTSDGTNISINYTGSGWKLLSGSARRLYAGANYKFDENGQEITQTSIDGKPVAVKHLINTEKSGYFRISDNKMLGGLRVVDVDRVVNVNGGMMDPDSDGNAYVDISTRDESGYTLTELMWHGKSFQGSTTPHLDDLGEDENPDSPGTVVGLEAGFETYWAWNGTSYEDIIEAWLRSVGLLRLTATKGLVLGSIASHILPNADNTYDCGSTAMRIRKYYGASSTISTSDEREKHDIHAADPEMLFRFIMALDADWFRLNGLPDELMIGFVAQKFREAMRKAGMPDDYGGFVDELPDHSRLAIRYEQLVAPIVSVVQRQQREIEELKRQVKALLER